MEGRKCICNVKACMCMCTCTCVRSMCEKKKLRMKSKKGGKEEKRDRVNGNDIF